MEPQRSFGMEMRTLNILILRKISEKTGMTEDDIDVSFIQGRIIDYLCRDREGGVFQRDIEHTFEIRRPTATKILQSMERRGLIERQGVDYDARLKQIKLTEKAMRVRERVVEIINRFESELVSGISNDELELFFNVLDKIKHNLSSL